MDKELHEWTSSYIKNKDLSAKKIVKIEEKGNEIIAQYKDKINTHYIEETLDEKILSKIQNNDYKTVVCLNNNPNFKFLIKKWNKLSEIKNLTIIFVSLENNDKWLINPQLHSMVADPETLESGLKTMFDTANGKIVEVVKSKKKGSMFEESSNNKDDEEPEENNDEK